MRKPPVIFLALAAFSFSLPFATKAQERPPILVESLSPGEGGATYDFKTGLAIATNGVIVKYGDAVLTADSVTVNQQTGEAVADGRVRIQQGDQLWDDGRDGRRHGQTDFVLSEQARDGMTAGFSFSQPA